MFRTRNELEGIRWTGESCVKFPSFFRFSGLRIDHRTKLDKSPQPFDVTVSTHNLAGTHHT